MVSAFILTYPDAAFDDENVLPGWFDPPLGLAAQSGMLFMPPVSW